MPQGTSKASGFGSAHPKQYLLFHGQTVERFAMSGGARAEALTNLLQSLKNHLTSGFYSKEELFPPFRASHRCFAMAIKLGTRDDVSNYPQKFPQVFFGYRFPWAPNDLNM